MANPTLLLATLDETLAFTDQAGAGAFTGVDPVRYSAVGSQEGGWYEQAGTNKFVNPVAGATIGSWGVFANRTVTQTSTLPAAMPGWLASLVTTGIVCAATSNLANASPTSHTMVLTDADHVFSAYIYIPTAWTGGTLRLSADSYTSMTGTLFTNANMSLRDQWQRLVVGPLNPDAGDLSGSFHWSVAGNYNSGESFYFTGCQVEASSYVTSLISGGLGDGYAWSGTANNSASTRAASSAAVDPTARIDASSGAIAMRYKRLIDTGAEEIILTSGVAGSGTDYLEIGVDVNDDLYMEWNSDNAGAERVTIATTIAVDTDYFFYFDWDGTTIRASIDNGSLSSDTRAAAEGDWSTGDLTLSAAVGSHVVGPFLVADRPLTSKEIATLNARSTWGFSTLRGGNRYNIFQLRPKAA